MAALTAARNTLKLKDTAVWDLQFVPIADNVKIFVGGMVALDVNGRAIAATTTALGAVGPVVGKAEVPYLPQPPSQNASPNTVYDNTFAGHVAGGLTVAVRTGVFKYASGTGADLVTQANLQQDVFAMDDQTVSTVATGRVKAGRVLQVDTDGIWVAMGYFIR